MNRPVDLFGAILRQWGCLVPLQDNPAAAAQYLRSVKGSGTLVVNAGELFCLEMECDSIFEASSHVLVALAELSIDTLMSGRDMLSVVRPEMFVWIPDRQDVTDTDAADAVIARVKRSMAGGAA